MANQGNYQLKIGVATDRASFEQLQKSLQAIINMAQQPGNELNKDLQEAARNAQLVGKALNNSYNSKLGTMNIAKMNKELQKSNVTVKSLHTSFSKVGADGANAFNTLAAASMRANVQIKQSNKLLDSLAVTMTNTVKWGITSGIWNAVTSSISGAVSYVEKLDRSLNNIRIVTNKNAEAMAEFAKQANNAAKAVGAGTTDYTDAALIYYQQGLADAEVKARTEVTLKAANVTQQSAEEVSEQLTAVWNGYKVTANEAELYIDKLAAVAASTAADLEELSTGMSKVASAAASMGVDIDQLNAQLATIVSVTRQAPEAVGTALKTIYARMGDLQIGGEDEFGVKLGEVTQDLAAVGINVLDQTGNLRDMGEVIEEVAAKWDQWNDAQRTAVAISIAGKRQYNNLIALFDNWDMYSSALDTSVNSLGTLQKQQDIYMQSTDAKLQKMRTSWEKVYSTVIDTDALNTGIDVIGNVAEAFNSLAGAFGGGMKTINAAVAILASVFSGQIAKGLVGRARNKDIKAANSSTIDLQNQYEEFGLIQTYDLDPNNKKDAKAMMLQAHVEENKTWLKGYDKYRNALTPEQYNEVVKTGKQRAEISYKYDKERFEAENLFEERRETLGSGVNKARQEYRKISQDSKASREDKVNAYNRIAQEQEKYNALLEEEEKQHKENLAIIKQKEELEHGTVQEELDAKIGTQEQLDRDARRTNSLNALAGTAQMAAGAIMGISAAIDILNNDEMTGVEKLTALLFTVGPSLAMAVDGFGKFRNAISGFIQLKNKETAADIAGAAAKELDTAATKRNTKASGKNAAADVKETATELASKAADSIPTKTGGGKGLLGLFGKGAGGAAKAAGGLAGGAAAGIAAGVGIAVIAAFTIAKKIIEKNAEKELEAATKKAEVAMEKATETKEASDRINSLAKDFKNLASEIEEQGEYTSELRNKVYDLCIQYEQEDLAIKSLAMSYSELETAMIGVQKAANQDTIDAADRAQNALITQANAALAKQNADQGFFKSLFSKGSLGATSNALEFSSGLWKDKNEQALLKELTSLSGITQDGNSLKFDYEELANNWDSFNEILTRYGSTLAGHTILKDLQKAQANLDPIMQSFQASLDTETQAGLELISADLNAKSVTSTQDYMHQKDALLKEANKYLDSDEAEEWVKNKLATLNDEISRQAMIEGEINLTLNKTNLEHVTQDIQEWSEDEKNFIFLRLDRVKTMEEAEALLKEFSEYIAITSAASGINLASSFVQTEGVLSKTDTENLYTSRFGKQGGVDQEAFRRMSEEEQESALLNYGFQELSYVAANQDAVVKELNDSLENYKQENQNILNEYEQAKKDLEIGIGKVQAADNLDEDTKKRFTEDYVLQLIRNRDKLIAGSQEAIDYEIYKTYAVDIGNAVDAYDEFNNVINDYTSSITTVENIQGLWQKKLEETTTALEKQKKSLETFQNSFKTITDVVSEYNTHGSLTIDSLLSLLEVEPAYINALELEGGQLKFNQEAMDVVLETRLKNLKAIFVQNTASQMALTLENQEIKLNEKQLQLLGSLVTKGVESGDTYETIANAVAAAGIEFDGLEEFIEACAVKIDMFSLVSLDAKEAIGDFSKELIEWQEEFDRYWTINKRVDKVTKAIEKLNKEQEKLSGQELINSIKAENTLLDEQAKKYQDVAETQEKRRAELETILADKYGVKFNDANEITNYEAITQAQTDYLNDELEKGNEDAQKYFDGFKEALDEYDQLFYDEMDDTQEKLAENARQRMENNLEIWKIGVEEALTEAEKMRELNDYNAQISEDVSLVYKDLDAVSNKLTKDFDSFTGSGGTIDTLKNSISTIKAEMDKIASGEGSTMFASMSEANKALEEEQEKLRDANLEAKKTANELYETYLEKIDQVIDKFGDFQEGFERINKNLEYQKELIELLYGDKATELYEDLYSTQLKVSQQEIISLQQQKALYEDLIKDTAEGTQERLKYQEQIYELESQINDKTLEHIQILKDQYANAVEKILNQFEDEVTGGFGLDELEKEWDRTKAKADKYYDTVEGLYQIQTLSGKITQSINDASEKGQKKLKTLHDKEIAYLREKKNLTEYDVKAAEARYQIALKEIALEEAQQAKNSVKLVRDTQGNWTYQYVANQEDVMTKQQEMLDAYQSLYNLADDAYTKNIDSLIALNKEYIESAKQIANDSTISDEERVAKLEQLRDRYIQDYDLLIKENELYTNNLAKTYAGNIMAIFKVDGVIKNLPEGEANLITKLTNMGIEDFTRLEEVCDKDSSLAEAIQSVMKDGYEGWNTKVQNFVNVWQNDGKTGIADKITVITGELITTIGTLQTNIKNLGELGVSISVGNNFSDVAQAAEALKGEIESFSRSVDQDMWAASQGVDEFKTSWDSLQSSISLALEEYKRYEEYVNNHKVDPNYKEHGGGEGGEVPDDRGGIHDDVNPNDTEKSYIQQLLDVYNDNSKSSSERGQAATSLMNTVKTLNLSSLTEEDALGLYNAHFLSESEYSRYQSLKQGPVMGPGTKPAYDQDETDFWDGYNSTSNFLTGSPVIKTEENPAETKKYIKAKEPYVSVPYYYTSTNGKMEKAASLVEPGTELSSTGTYIEKTKVVDGIIYYFGKVGNRGYWFSENDIIPFNTGGYTGEWGSSGRLAVLHQKELVLNAADTENILSAVSSIRTIANLGSSVNDVVMRSISRMMLEMSNLNTHANYNTEASKSVGDTVFEIHAEFPDANDTNAIREAIMSLPNLASQYVSRYKTV